MGFQAEPGNQKMTGLTETLPSKLQGNDQYQSTSRSQAPPGNVDLLRLCLYQTNLDGFPGRAWKPDKSRLRTDDIPLVEKLIG
jgi:hypothetical protein